MMELLPDFAAPRPLVALAGRDSYRGRSLVLRNVSGRSEDRGRSRPRGTAAHAVADLRIYCGAMPTMGFQAALVFLEQTIAGGCHRTRCRGGGHLDG